jgi:hypothetical protein
MFGWVQQEIGEGRTREGKRKSRDGILMRDHDGGRRSRTDPRLDNSQHPVSELPQVFPCEPEVMRRAKVRLKLARCDGREIVPCHPDPLFAQLPFRQVLVDGYIESVSGCDGSRRGQSASERRADHDVYRAGCEAVRRGVCLEHPLRVQVETWEIGVHDMVWVVDPSVPYEDQRLDCCHVHRLFLAGDQGNFPHCDVRCIDTEP